MPEMYDEILRLYENNNKIRDLNMNYLDRNILRLGNINFLGRLNKLKRISVFFELKKNQLDFSKWCQNLNNTLIKKSRKLQDLEISLNIPQFKEL